MSVRRVEAGMIFALPLKPFVAITVGAAVCWQKKVSPLEDCPPEHLCGAVSCRWQGKCRSVQPGHGCSHRQREEDSWTHLAEPESLWGRKVLLWCKLGQKLVSANCQRPLCDAEPLGHRLHSC